MRSASSDALSRSGASSRSPLHWDESQCLLFKYRALIGGGGAPEIHVSRLLSQHAQSLKGMEAYCFQAYADALEVIPTTLAENAGLNPIAIVTELRNRHALGERNAGINVRKVSSVVIYDLVGCVLNMYRPGPYLEHFGRRCRPALVGVHKRNRTVYGDGVLAVENR